MAKEKTEHKPEFVLKKEDWIVHSYHGVSHIEGVDRKRLDGKEKSFFKVKTDELTYWIPIGKVDVQHIRAVSSVSTLKKALTTIRHKPHKLENDYRSRRARINEIFNKGSLHSKVELIRDLNARITTQRDNIYEEKILDKLKGQFIDEWTVAFGCERSEAVQKLEEALKTSVLKLDHNE